METGIRWKFESRIWYNSKKESAIMESGITRKRNLFLWKRESGITWKWKVVKQRVV